MHDIWAVVVTIITRKLCYRKDDRAMRAIYVDREPLRRYGHSKLSNVTDRRTDRQTTCDSNTTRIALQCIAR